jgi:tetratricopeptide (TPR) repeat protein
MDKDVKQSADLYEMMAWFYAHRKQVISISATVLLIAAVVGGIIWHKNYVETQAADALSAIKGPTTAQEIASPAASTAEPYLKVDSDYPGTRAGSRALLVAGGILFEAGKFDQAKQAFDKFAGEYPESPLLTQALVGQAASLEAQGKIAEAATHYDELIRRHQTDATLPQAKSALARLYVEQNKPEMAARIYEELARANNNDSWSIEAGIQLQELLAKYPALKKAAPAPSAPMMLKGATNAAASTAQ